MRVVLLGALLTGAIAGCTGKSEPPQKVANGSAADSAAAAKDAETTSSDSSSDSDWTLQESSSAIDGKKLVASRVFGFDQRNAQFIVNVECVATSGAATLEIQSLVGEPTSPSEESRIISKAVGSPITQPLAVATLSSMPVGRLKTASDSVEELSSYFRIDKEYGNYARFLLMNDGLRALIEKDLGWSPYTTQGFLLISPQIGDINQARQIASELPMAVEVSNGAGSFELNIENSSEVATTLRACGSDKPLVAGNYAAKLQALRSQDDVASAAVTPQAASTPPVHDAERIQPSEDALPVDPRGDAGEDAGQ